MNDTYKAYLQATMICLFIIGLILNNWIWVFGALGMLFLTANDVGFPAEKEKAVVEKITPENNSVELSKGRD